MGRGSRLGPGGHVGGHRWLVQPVTSRELVDAYLANAVFDAHHDDPEFGYGLVLLAAALGLAVFGE